MILKKLKKIFFSENDKYLKNLNKIGIFIKNKPKEKIAKHAIEIL